MLRRCAQSLDSDRTSWFVFKYARVFFIACIGITFAFINPLVLVVAFGYMRASVVRHGASRHSTQTVPLRRETSSRGIWSAHSEYEPLSARGCPATALLLPCYCPATALLLPCHGGTARAQGPRERVELEGASQAILNPCDDDRHIRCVAQPTFARLLLETHSAPRGDTGGLMWLSAVRWSAYSLMLAQLTPPMHAGSVVLAVAASAGTA